MLTCIVKAIWMVERNICSPLIPMLSTVMKIKWFSSLRVQWHLQYVISFWRQQRQRLNSHQDQITLDFMWRYACKQKTKISWQFNLQKLYLVSLWVGYITSPWKRERLLWQSGRPSRWHPQHMWHDLLQYGYTGAPSHRANSRLGPQMCVAPLGHGGRMRCPSLCGSADAPHNCQAFSFIRPGSDTYRGVLPEAITAASLRRSTHTHTHISKKEPISSVEGCDGEGFLVFVFWICAGEGR